MEIISHRGYWKKVNEKNTRTAFQRSLDHGFGLETDIRDYLGKLVISHNIADKDSILFEDFLKLYSENKNSLPLALNIKSDGLQNQIKTLLEEYSVVNYFLFDMSVPDLIIALASGLNCYTRQSEYEQSPSLYEKSMGVWIDCFETDWIDEKTIEDHLDNNKKLCIVSPDLHRREYLTTWQKYKTFKCIESNNILLCTDFPEEARDYFNNRT